MCGHLEGGKGLAEPSPGLLSPRSPPGPLPVHARHQFNFQCAHAVHAGPAGLPTASPRHNPVRSPGRQGRHRLQRLRVWQAGCPVGAHVR